MKKCFSGVLLSVAILSPWLGWATGVTAPSTSKDLWSNGEFDFLSGGEGDHLKAMEVIQTPEEWFEVVELPGNVYGFKEHGHSERVNSFWILGKSRDILYDTGMGIASIRSAIDYVRKLESLPDHEIMVINSHAHPDHIGGNSEFENVYVADDDWTERRIVEGIQPGTWSEYYAAMLPAPAPEPPAGFDPSTHQVSPFPSERIRFVKHGEIIDLGDRQIRVIRTTSHSSADLLLYEEKEGLLFTGDAFTPLAFLVSDFQAFERDVETMAALSVNYHFNTHGPPLIDLSWREKVLVAIRKVNGGEYCRKLTPLLGFELPTYSSAGVENLIDATELLELLP